MEQKSNKQIIRQQLQKKREEQFKKEELKLKADHESEVDNNNPYLMIEQEERRKVERIEAQKKLEQQKREQQELEETQIEVYDKQNSIEMALIKCIDQIIMVRIEEFAKSNLLEIRNNSTKMPNAAYDLKIDLDEFY